MLNAQADDIVGKEANKMSSNQSLLRNSVQLSVLYQLEQRKVQKLEKENLALLERNRMLLTNEDDARIEQLAHDRTKQKLIHLRTLTKKTIVSLQTGLKEFNAFCNLVDDAIEEEDRQGAIAYEPPINPKISALHAPLLGRIPETGMSDNIENCSTTQKVNDGTERGAEPANMTYVVDKSPKPARRLYSSQVAEEGNSTFNELQSSVERTPQPQRADSPQEWTLKLTPDPRKMRTALGIQHDSNLSSLRKSKPLYTSTPKMGLRGKVADCQLGIDLSVFDSERVETPERVDPPMAAVTPNTSNSPPKAAGNPRMSRALNRKKDSSAVDEQEAAIVPPPKRRRSRIPMLSTGSKSLKNKRRPSDSSPEHAPPPPQQATATSSSVRHGAIDNKSFKVDSRNNTEHQSAPQDCNINNRPKRAAAKRVRNYMETSEAKAPRRKKKASKA